jgi:hypothetical protein
MPKTDIDYSNTIIYKITCKSPDVNEVYVGHTTNFVQRKFSHKQSCTNIKSPNHNFRLYQVIRQHNGWDNWNMEIVNFFNCKDSYEARQKEQEYFVLLKATLNSIEPLPKPKPNNVTMDVKECKQKKTYFCDYCKTRCSNEDTFKKHNETRKHKEIISGERAAPTEATLSKNISGFTCEACKFKCYKEYNYKAHLATPKHQKFTKVYQSLQKNATLSNSLVCVCSKKYSTRMGLWKHKQKCIFVKNLTNDTNDTNEIVLPDLKDINSIDKDDIIIKLLKDNEEIRQILKEVIPKMGNNTIINNNNNNNTTNNNTLNNFNLNFFLNEQCKDALNITEFVESLKITFDDLLYSKKNGLVQGISNVMIRGLKELDIYKRPIHCTDKKRETMYIKDKEKWEKDETHEIMKNTIEMIADKERNALQIWTDENPDWIETEQKQIAYLTMLRNISEPIEDEEKNGRKIIRAVSREVIIDKKD